MCATRSPRILVLLTTVVVAGSAAAEGDQVCTSRRGGRPLRADTIGLVPEAHVTAKLLEEAISVWRGCSNYEHDFPAFVVGNNGDRTIRVMYVRGSSRAPRCGFRLQDTVVVYASALRDGRPVACGPLAYNLAHELGHVLGLHDARPTPACRRHIMAPIDAINILTRTPQESECRSVGERWRTLAEIDPDHAPLPGFATFTTTR